MADIYFGENGSDITGDGSSGNPYRSRDFSVTQGVAGTDTLVLMDGTNSVADAVGFWNMNDDFLHRAQTRRGATLIGDNASYVARTSSGLTVAMNPFRVQGIVFDGRETNSQAFEIGQDASDDLIIQFHDCEFKAGSNYCLFDFMQRGRQELVNCKFSGSPGTSAFTSTSFLGGHGDQVLDMQLIDLDLTLTSADEAFFFEKTNNLTNTLDIFVKGVTGSVSSVGAVSVNFIDLFGAAAPVVTGCDVTLNADDDATGFNGVLIRGNTVAVTSDCTISNNNIKFNSPVGYAIMLGQSTVDANVSGGTVAGNTVTGKYYASSTPHNFLMGQATTGVCRGNTSIEGYVGYLISKTTTADVSGNLAFDCYGPNYYIKGATDCTVKDNIAVLSGKFAQRDNGVIAVIDQGGIDTAGATIQENLVIVSDISKIHSLAQIADASQVCSFVRNTYIKPRS